MIPFDDARLEAPTLADHEGLRWLASAGARVRRLQLDAILPQLERGDRPRGVLLMGAEARLMRAVLEPVCPVPLMAWSGATLPAWVGPLDLVAIVDDQDPSSGLLEASAGAARRGATVLVAAQEHSPLAEVTSGAETTLVPVDDHDPTAAAVGLLTLLGQLGLGPHINLEGVAEAVDLVAESCSPLKDLSSNPGKELAIAFADHVPLIWGGSVLANRAGRRIGEALRHTSGVPALAADASELSAVLRSTERRDPFADPDDQPRTPMVLLLDVDEVPPAVQARVSEIENLADAASVRVVRVASGAADSPLAPVERSVTLLARGLYAVEYLKIGLCR